MNEARRKAYLDAMGIDVWVPRAAPSRAQAGPESTAGAAEPEPQAPPRAEVVTQTPETASDLVPPPVSPSAPESPPTPVEEDEIPPWVAASELEEPALSPALPEERPERPVPPREPAVAGLDWAALESRVGACQACPELVAHRSRTVFGVGNRQADWLIIGEAPGAEEDRQGEPFVGRAGKLLNNMLLAVGLTRERVYIANILKCRPPRNRDPQPEEAASCRDFLERQIALVRPRVILALGRIAAQNLLQTDTSLGGLRGRVHRLETSDAAVVVTYHPAYLLRSPADKRKAWDDLRLAVAASESEETSGTGS